MWLILTRVYNKLRQKVASLQMRALILKWIIHLTLVIISRSKICNFFGFWNYSRNYLAANYSLPIEVNNYYYISYEIDCARFDYSQKYHYNRKQSSHLSQKYIPGKIIHRWHKFHHLIHQPIIYILYMHLWLILTKVYNKLSQKVALLQMRALILNVIDGTLTHPIVISKLIIWHFVL